MRRCFFFYHFATVFLCHRLLCQAFSLRLSIKPASNSFSLIETTATAPIQTTRGAKQLIEFKEPTTGVTVKLIGCMHYNPASIKLTTDTINNLAQKNKLGSVIIESCDIRWDKTKELPRIIQNFLLSEMKAACELTMDVYERPVVLGDQRINITINSMGQGLKETALDFVSPWNGGWNRLVGNVTAAREEALPSGENYLDIFAFFDPVLMLAAPVSLIKYPLSYLCRSPIPTIAFFILLFLSEQPADAATLVTVDQMTITDWMGSLAFSAVEVALFARIFLKELLAERNKLLARNILEQCKLYSTKKARRVKMGTDSLSPLSWFGSRKKEEAFEVVYVKESAVQMPGDVITDDMTVVAVLGMAHCNGIAKLLKEGLV